MEISNQSASLSRAGLGSVEELTVREAQRMGSRALDDLREMRGEDMNSVGTKFEELFAGMLAKQLRSGLEGFFGEGPGADTFGAWMDNHLGQQMADQELLGIAKMLRDQAGRPGIQGPIVDEASVGSNDEDGEEQS